MTNLPVDHAALCSAQAAPFALDKAHASSGRAPSGSALQLDFGKMRAARNVRDDEPQRSELGAPRGIAAASALLAVAPKALELVAWRQPAEPLMWTEVAIPDEVSVDLLLDEREGERHDDRP